MLETVWTDNGRPFTYILGLPPHSALLEGNCWRNTDNPRSSSFLFFPLYLGKIPVGFKARDKYLYKVLLAASKNAITWKWLHTNLPSRSDWIGKGGLHILRSVTHYLCKGPLNFALMYGLSTFFLVSFVVVVVCFLFFFHCCKKHENFNKKESCKKKEGQRRKYNFICVCLIE